METPRRLPRTNRFKNRYASKIEEAPKKVATEIRFNSNPKRGSRARWVIPKDARLSSNMRSFLQRMKNKTEERRDKHIHLQNLRRNDAHIKRRREFLSKKVDWELRTYNEEACLYSIGIRCDFYGGNVRREWGKKANPKSRSGNKRVRHRRPQKFKAKGGRRRTLDIDLNF